MCEEKVAVPWFSHPSTERSLGFGNSPRFLKVLGKAFGCVNGSSHVFSSSKVLGSPANITRLTIIHRVRIGCTLRSDPRTGEPRVPHYALFETGFGHMNELTTDGCKLAWWTRGQGPAILFIQGCGVQGSGWLPQVEALSKKYTCIWFDNRGMGNSQPLGVKLTVHRMAQDALAILQASGHTQAHVVGHSLGGLIAQRLAIIQPSSVKSLALLCTFLGGQTGRADDHANDHAGLGTVIGTKRMRRMAFLRLVTQPGTNINQDELAERLGQLFGHDLAEQPPIVKAQLAAMRAEDVTLELRELGELPTLIINARHDPIAPPSCGKAIATAMSHSRYVEVADASHALPITHAEWVNELLENHFLDASQRDV